MVRWVTLRNEVLGLENVRYMYSVGYTGFN